jgi:hypothetical protein
MALSEGEKAVCREIAREIITDVLEQHILSCPWGGKVIRFKWLFVGVLIGSGAAGGGAAAVLLKAFLGG